MPENASTDRPEQIAVRMYRGLLGDCFLLRHEIGGRRYHALIDCGVLQCIGTNKPNTMQGVVHIADVVQDIARDTGGHLDLVIGTHEHFDHLSGFIRENEAFERMTIDAVWIAWTEDPHDELAQAILQKRSKGLAGLAALVDPAARPASLAAAARDPAVADRLASIADMLQFYGEIEPWTPAPGQGVSGKKPYVPREPKIPPRSCADVFAWLRNKVGADKVSYLSPGQQVRFGLDERLVANVLGPPRTRKRLIQLDPSSGAAREVYLTQSDDVEALASNLTFQALRGPDDPDNLLAKSDFPFANRFRRSDPERAVDALSALYYSPQHRDRRIDGEWLGSAETLALKIDGDVNNTSLALAIEIPGGDVLLFPADAQVGNWLSWHDQQYPSEPKDGTGKKSAADLLSRVILYKVGHHASHNATARTLGLELMTSPDLVAMIPVVAAVAREQVTKSNKDGWAMPYGDLYDRLKEKCRNRIVRGDGDPAAERTAFSAPASRFSITYGPEADPLWVELATKIAVPHRASATDVLRDSARAYA